MVFQFDLLYVRTCISLFPKWGSCKFLIVCYFVTLWPKHRNFPQLLPIHLFRHQNYNYQNPNCNLIIWWLSLHYFPMNLMVIFDPFWNWHLLLNFNFFKSRDKAFSFRFEFQFCFGSFAKSFVYKLFPYLILNWCPRIQKHLSEKLPYSWTEAPINSCSYVSLNLVFYFETRKYFIAFQEAHAEQIIEFACHRFDWFDFRPILRSQYFNVNCFIINQS